MAERRSLRLAAGSSNDVNELQALEVVFDTVLSGDATTAQLRKTCITGMGQLSGVLELAEAEYQQLMGDPYYNSWQRSHYNIGRYMAKIKEQQDEDPDADLLWRTYNGMIMPVQHPQAGREQSEHDEEMMTTALRTTGLRLLLACATSMGHHACLKNASFVSKLRIWASAEPKSREELEANPAEKWCEAQRVYSMGLLAIALTDSTQCDELVRTGFMGYLARELHCAATPGEDHAAPRAAPARTQALVSPLQEGTPLVRVSNAAVLDSPEDVAADVEVDAHTPAGSSRQGSPDDSGSEEISDRRLHRQPVVSTVPSARTAPSSSSRAPRTAEKDDVGGPSRVLQTPGPEARQRNAFSAPSVELLRLEDASISPQPLPGGLTSTAPDSPPAAAGEDPCGSDSPAGCNISAQEERAAADRETLDDKTGRAGTAAGSTEGRRGEEMAVNAQRGAVTGAAARDQVLEFPVQLDTLAALRVRYLIQCASCMGEYVESVLPLMEWGGVKLLTSLLQRARQLGLPYLGDALRLLGNFLAHRRLAESMVDQGGIELLLALPRNHFTHSGLSLVYFGLGSMPTALDRLAALPNGIPAQVIAALLQHYTSAQDTARKNAAVFFGAALSYRTLLDAFDRADGLRTILTALQGSLLLVKGGPAMQELRMEKQVAYHTCQALRHYFEVHMVLRVSTLQRRLWGPSLPREAASKAQYLVDVTSETVEAAVAALQGSQQLLESFLRAPWPAVDAFLASHGPALMLDLIQASPGERYFNDIAFCALDVLHLAAQLPAGRRALLACGAVTTPSGQQGPMAVLLAAAGGQSFMGDPEVMQAALKVILTCVSVPQCLQPGRPLQDATTEAPGAPEQPQASSQQVAVGGRCLTLPAAEASLAMAMAPTRRLVRDANGLRTLLGLLHARPSSANVQPAMAEKLRALAAQTLLGLAQDAEIRHTLTNLQVARTLAELMHESAGACGVRRSSIPPVTNESSPSATWRATFTATAMDLIALITPGMGSAGTAAAHDAAAPALQKMERTAIAAASHITYDPNELLLIIRDHLAASGLQSAADALTREARLLGLREAPEDTSAPPRPESAHQGTPAGGAWAAKKRISFAPSLLQSCGKKTPSSQIPGQTSAAGDYPIRPAQLSAAGSHASSPATGLNLCQAAAGSTPRLPPIRMHAATPLTGKKRPAASQAEPQPAATLRALGDATPVCRRLACSAEGGSPSWGHSPLHPTPSRASFSGQRLLQAREGGSPSGRDGIRRQAGLAAQAEANLRRSMLANLPSRRAAAAQNAMALPFTTPQLARASIRRSMLSPPDRRPVVPSDVGVDDKSGSSRLSSIVLQYLRQQHKTACLSAPQPISTLPPLSLTHPNSLPQAKHALNAPPDVARRVMDRQIMPFGGSGGKRLDRHLIYSRFRHQRSIRQDDGAALRSCAFLASKRQLLLGTHRGEVRMYEAASGTMLDEVAMHTQPIHSLKVHEAGHSWVLSSSRSEVRLSDFDKYDTDPIVAEWSGCRGGVFSPDALQVAAVSSSTRSNSAFVFDTATGAAVLNMTSSDAVGGRAPRDICFSSTGEMLLWGPALWDPRVPRMVHCFDLFADSGGGSTLHPAGLEAILNSEVWDLRTQRLLRSVPVLDGTSLAFNGTGDVAYATLRHTSDDLFTVQQSRHTRHPLHTAFRTVDATDYTEIATVSVDGRCVLDLVSEPLDSSLALVTVEPEGLTSSARLYDVGRCRLQGDESDYEIPGPSDDESETNDSEEEEEEEVLGMPASVLMQDSEDEAEDSEGEEEGEEQDGVEEMEEEGEGGGDSDAEDEGSGDSGAESAEAEEDGVDSEVESMESDEAEESNEESEEASGSEESGSVAVEEEGEEEEETGSSGEEDDWD